MALANPGRHSTPRRYRELSFWESELDDPMLPRKTSSEWSGRPYSKPTQVDE